MTEITEYVGDLHKIDDAICCIRFLVEWKTKSKTKTKDIDVIGAEMCDLDLKLFCYDERVLTFQF